MGTLKTFAGSLEKFSVSQPFHVGWYLKHIQSGEELSYRGGESFSAGSVRKLFILMGVLKLVNEQKLSLSQRLTIKSRYQKNRSGVFRHLTSGYVVTLKDALIMMIIVSDNACAGVLVDLVGIKMLNKYCQSLGFTKTRLVTSFPPLGKEASKRYMDTTSPNDVGRLLDLVLVGSKDKEVAKVLGCSTQLCKLALDILSWQELNNKIPLLLPDGVKVAHKTGSRKGVHNDSGIVYEKGRPLFILSVFTNNVPSELSYNSSGRAAAFLFIGRLARMCYDHYCLKLTTQK